MEIFSKSNDSVENFVITFTKLSISNSHSSSTKLSFCSINQLDLYSERAASSKNFSTKTGIDFLIVCVLIN